MVDEVNTYELDKRATELAVDLLAKKYLSTTYAALTIVFTIIFLIISLANTYVNWSNVLNVSQELNETIRSVFFILSFFFCLNFIVSIINVFFTARGSGDRYIDSLMRKASDLVTVRNDYFRHGWTRLLKKTRRTAQW